MAEWSTYSLSDLLLFSSETYFRLIARFNAEAWPAQAIAILAGLFLIFAVARPTEPLLRLALAVLAGSWAATSWFFVWQRYAAINWLMIDLAPVLVAQFVLLLALAARRSTTRHLTGETRAGQWTALAVLAIAVVACPVITAMSAGALDQAEVFGLMPDPTAGAMLAVLAVLPGMLALLAMVVPLLWCVLSALTLWTLGSPTFAVPLILVSLAVAARLQVRRRQY